MPIAKPSSLHPAPWLCQLAHLNPAPWRWGRSIRAALGMGLPLAIGLAADALSVMLWLALGTLFQTLAEKDGPYEAIFRKMMISAPIGATGFLLGYLGVLPWGYIVATLVVLAAFAAIISSYSAALSAGALQFLVMGTVAIANPEIGHFWQASLLFLAGTLLYAVMLGIEILIYPTRPRRELTAAVLRALAGLARSKAKGDPIETSRQQVTATLAGLYALLMQTRYHASGRNAHLDNTAAVLQRCDALLPVILASHEIEQLRATALELEQLADAYLRGERQRPRLPLPRGAALPQAVADLSAALWGQEVSAPRASEVQRAPALTMHLERLDPGRSALLLAMALALCVGISYSVHWVDTQSHWYWIPMTVIIIMKPDLGSVFARAIHRSVGTLAGVVIGGIMLAWVPVGPLFVLLVSLIALCLPWASQRSYALSALTLTPLVLILIDFVSPESKDVHYATLRLVDTLMGAAIALIFGYLIWPKQHSRELNQSFLAARQAIARYLRAVLNGPAGQSPALTQAQIGGHRRVSYGCLADMRAALQKSLSEPPPAGREAAAWYPLVASAERMCDAITEYSVHVNEAGVNSHRNELEHLADRIAGDPMALDPDLSREGKTDVSPEARLITVLNAEMSHLQALTTDHRVEVFAGGPGDSTQPWVARAK